jgi:hypothetical protein
MTTPITPQPTDTDALRALEQAATPAPWAHEHDGGHIVHGPGSTVAEAEYAPDARLIAAMRNTLPALLTELDRLRGNHEILSCSTLGEAYDRLESLLEAEAERDQLRAEVRTLENSDALALAQAEAERDSAKAYVEQVCGQRDRALSDRDAARADADRLRTELAARTTELETARVYGGDVARQLSEARADADKLRGELEQAQARLRAIDAGNAAMAEFNVTIWEGRRIQMEHGPCDVYCCAFPELPSSTVTMLQLSEEMLRHLRRTHDATPTAAPQPDACNCQSTDGTGPWHPMGDTPTCPSRAVAGTGQQAIDPEYHYDLTAPQHNVIVGPGTGRQDTATCGAPLPDTSITCSYPPGHPPIPAKVRGVGNRDMEHGNETCSVWWNGRTATVHGDALAAAVPPAADKADGSKA